MARVQPADSVAPGVRIGALLRQYRLVAGLTQAELAERAGMSAHGIQKLESGATHPYRDTAERLIRALKLADQDEAQFRMAARPAPRRAQPQGFPHSSTGIVPHTNLPNSATTYIARAGEMERLKARLQNSRLLTLSGPGGCGKTRLALETARQLENDYVDGVWLVELASLTDDSLVAQSIATSMGVPNEPGRPVVEALTDFLRGRHVLLILDNCEHLIAACAKIVDTLLRFCAHLQVLTTSRELLGVDGEATWRVASLTTIGPPGQPDSRSEHAARVCASESGELFLDRGRLVSPTFEITAQNARAVAQICRRLDGIPLAIELAAARLGVLSPDQIAARLDQSFRLLTGGNRTVMRRQQTLHATIDWSYQLLSEAERRLVRHLAVFAGGWSLEAAEAVGADPRRPHEDVFELLSQLVAKSMVLVEESGGNEPSVVRYRFLETIRQYAEERLVAANEAESARMHHRDWYLGLAEQAVEGMEGADQKRWTDRLELEYDNLRAALSWSAAHPESSAALLLLTGYLGRFWQARGYANEGIAWLEAALSQSTTGPSSARARALNWRGVLEMWDGKLPAACMFLEESISHARAVKDWRVLSMALRHLSIALFATGDVQRPVLIVEEAVAVSREEGYMREIAWNLAWLAEASLGAGRLNVVEPLVAESIEVGRQSGDTSPVVAALRSLIRLDWIRGDLTRARASIGEALKIAGQNSNRKMEMVFLQVGLGDIALAELDRMGAKHWYREALRTASYGVVRAFMAYALRRYAALCASGGDHVHAVRILGAASVVHDLTPLMDLSSAADDVTTTLRKTLGEDEFAAAWVEGQSITLEQAIAAILSAEPQQL
jgi:non-specific serine/threonine protein kinase